MSNPHLSTWKLFLLLESFIDVRNSTFLQKNSKNQPNQPELSNYCKKFKYFHETCLLSVIWHKFHFFFTFPSLFKIRPFFLQIKSWKLVRTAFWVHLHAIAVVSNEIRTYIFIKKVTTTSSQYVRTIIVSLWVTPSVIQEKGLFLRT